MTRRSRFWLIAVAAIAAFPFVFWAGLHTFMTATATPWHPDPQAVPTVTGIAPPPRLAGAVEQARQAVRAALAEQNLPGLSVAAGVDGELVWTEGFGWADLDSRIPVGPEMRFRIGTASMVLTSAAAGVLLERGRLTLDDEIRMHVPEFPGKQWPITLRQLMAHVGGVRNDGGDEGPWHVRCDRTIEGLQLFADRPLLFEPGTRFHVSSFGWILVSAAIEAAANEPLLSFMRAQIFEPLGMYDTIPDSATEPIPDRPTPYFPRYAADPRYGLHGVGLIDYSCYAGASVFLSTPADLVRFGMAVNGGRLLQPSTVQLLQTSQRLATGQETGYGLGWDLETVTVAGQPTRTAGHDGTTMGGMVASLLTVPDRGIVVSVTSNIAYADTFGVAAGVARAFAGARPR